MVRAPTHFAGAIHVIACGGKITCTESSQSLFENVDPTFFTRFGTATTNQFVDNDTLFLTSDAKLAERSNDKVIPQLLPDRVGDEHLGAEVFVKRFQAGGKIYGVANHRVIKAKRRP